MILARVAGRVLVGWLFVHAGVRVFRNPRPAIQVSTAVLARLRREAPWVTADDSTMIRANAALHIMAGSMLIVGKAPRLAALALAASLVPTTVAGHSYWTISDPVKRREQKAHFDKNLAILGGLLVAVGAAPAARTRIPAGRSRGSAEPDASEMW